jgi:hypothetical protein
MKMTAKNLARDGDGRGWIFESTEMVLKKNLRSPEIHYMESIPTA